MDYSINGELQYGQPKFVKNYSSEDLANEIKDRLLQGDQEIGAVYDVGLEPYNKSRNNKFYKIMPKSMFDIAHDFGAGFRQYDEIGEQAGGKIGCDEYVFRKKSECDKNAKNLIEKREKEVSRFQKKMEKRKDKDGYIFVTIYDQNSVFRDWSSSPSPQGTLTIPMTLKELSSAGLLKEDFQWQSKTKISSKDITEADEDKSLTQAEVSGIKGLIEKIKSLFRGNNRGEK